MKLLNDGKPLAVYACIDVVGVSVSEVYAGVCDGMDFYQLYQQQLQLRSYFSFPLLVYALFVVL